MQDEIPEEILAILDEPNEPNPNEFQVKMNKAEYVTYLDTQIAGIKKKRESLSKKDKVLKDELDGIYAEKNKIIGKKPKAKK